MQALCCPRRRAELRRGCPRSWATAARCPAIARCRIWPQRRWQFEFRNRASVCRYARSPWFCLRASQPSAAFGRTCAFGKRSGFIVGEILTISARIKPCKGTIHAVRHCVKDGPAARQAGRALDVLVRLQRARTIAPNGVEIKLRIPRTSTRRRPRNLTHCLIPTQPDDENQERRGARNKSRKTGQGPREARPRRVIPPRPPHQARAD